MRCFNCPLILFVIFQFLAVVTAFAPASPINPRATCHTPRSLNPIIHGRIGSNSLLSSKSAATILFSKKKAGGTAPAPGKGKVQVKLLKHVAGTGQAGEVVMVTPAFFNNKLRPTKSAQMITDEEVAREQKEAEKKEKEEIQVAEELRAKISEMTLKLPRKAGPDGQLFGGINTKMIVSELQALLQDEKDYLNQKHVKITEILDENGNELRGDIKHTGRFSSQISLRKNILAKFEIIVDSEE